MSTDLRQAALINKQALTDYPIHELLRSRWSPRAFDPKSVENAKLQSVFEAARWSASGGNLQPWSFIVGRKAEEPEIFARLVSCLGEGNAPWAAHAPVLGIGVANLFRRPEVLNRHAFHDLGMALKSLAIQAIALDLYVHFMGGFSADKAREQFSIPADHEAVTMFALGYLGDPDTLAERHKESELTERSRRPLTEFVFGDRWGITSPLLPTDAG